MKIIDYHLLQGDDNYLLGLEVKRWLAEGWELHGGPAMNVSNNRVVIVQAMVKHESAELAAQRSDFERLGAP